MACFCVSPAIGWGPIQGGPRLSPLDSALSVSYHHMTICRGHVMSPSEAVTTSTGSEMFLAEPHCSSGKAESEICGASGSKGHWIKAFFCTVTFKC